MVVYNVQMMERIVLCVILLCTYKLTELYAFVLLDIFGTLLHWFVKAAPQWYPIVHNVLKMAVFIVIHVRLGII